MKDRQRFRLEKKRGKQLWIEEKAAGFRCSHCRALVLDNHFMGTKHRNHCNVCLWSKHVDDKIPGDRKSECYAGMKPLGLTFKEDGELMIVHQCARCGKLSSNRIAGDDHSDEIFSVLENSTELKDLDGIKFLNENDLNFIETILFGKK